MRIAILGATSQIAKDLIQSFDKANQHKLVLFARRPDAVVAWQTSAGIENDWDVAGYEDFTASRHFDAVMNFVGVGNPAQATAMGASIFDITRKYDELALEYLKEHPDCRYIFLSSGAAYGSTFDKPATENTVARVPINNLQPQDWYGVAKLYAESRHRALFDLPIVDIRVFNYFSHTQNIEARYLITDILRAIRNDSPFKTSTEVIWRDYLHPSDFMNLVEVLLATDRVNTVVDAYSRSPIDKLSMLEAMKNKFGLRLSLTETSIAEINATGLKPNYYSLNRYAEKFGYTPTKGSLECLLLESELLLQQAQQ